MENYFHVITSQTRYYTARIPLFHQFTGQGSNPPLSFAQDAGYNLCCQ